MLIVFKREDKALYRKCENCTFFMELRDDKEQYPKTVGVICNAPQTVMATCFKYDWYRACGHYNGVSATTYYPTEFEEIENLRKTVANLKKIGKVKK
jgi:hypothetical protein